MKLVKESIYDFERGVDPKSALNIGYAAYYPYAFKNFEDWIYKYTNSPEYNTNISDIMDKCFIGEYLDFKPNDEQLFESKEKLIFKGFTISEIHDDFHKKSKQIEDYEYLYMLFFELDIWTVRVIEKLGLLPDDPGEFEQENYAMNMISDYNFIHNLILYFIDKCPLNVLMQKN